MWMMDPTVKYHNRDNKKINNILLDGDKKIVLDLFFAPMFFP